MRNKDLFTVIVADDEEELREAVCRLIPWERIGFRLLGSAGNGLDALELVEQLQPDLLLTDIHMPFISGTDLARQVRELQPLIQIAFLSGYDDFEYAKLGIEYEVISYLLKPISMEDLTAALKEIHSKMAAKFHYLSSDTGRGGSLQLAVASLLLDGFASPPEEETLLTALSELGFAVTAPYQMTVLATHVDGSCLPAAVGTIDKVLQKYYSCCSIASGGRALTVLVSEDGFSRLDMALDELLQVLRRLLDDGCVIGVSRKFNRINLCHSACREAIDAQCISGDGGIRRIGDMLAEPEIRAPAVPDAAAELEKLLYGADCRELDRYLTQCLSPAEGDEELAALQVLVAVRSILAGALSAGELSLLFRRYGLTAPLTVGMDSGELKRRIREVCMTGQDVLAERRQGGVGELCGRALRMIEQNYMDPELSLASVSEQLHVSPNYLSANMKKYAGDTFINLLIKKRMEAALALITSGGIRIAEAAGRCGYADQHYFSFCFKKYYGVSPAKMRRNSGKDGGGEA
ncbi:MAG: response regulator [Oscillospiraceae bacterium]|nr:response regulator [Oscillospiraceae bacterium]